MKKQLYSKENLAAYLRAFEILTETDIDAFLRLVEPSHLKKGDFLIKEGEVSNYIAYIQSGIFRSFYHSSEEEEVTFCFTFQNQIITAYTSWISQEVSRENIQALSKTDLFVISKENANLLEEEYPNWVKFFKHIAEQEYINLEKRVYLLQRETAEVRYQDLIKNYPEYFRSIPLHYLASYLGVTQRHLSRIRKNIVF
ncbi:Crp/Fnr family transcriptional regulator [Sediminitomix flava]|uniref:CRP-like cAMP-binding protein n=1 Tax=Sediminitomix flava TaxID=379075 RepID=A0A315ZCN9_SEDFL|nr:Crp/Fnr family transcriptional regulator [Sediminitomix flava]PWJ42863.1 CRP-like cAMP-binding protein [Sediminitomix flava]